MAWFKLHTMENVHAVYDIEADSADDVIKVFETGKVGEPSVFETISVESYDQIEAQ